MRGYKGTFCEHTVIGDMPSFQQHFIQAFGNNSIPQRNGKDISELYSLPAAIRVLNFSQDYVRKCIAEYGESFYDKVNMLSQVDNEGFEINNQAHPLETVAHDSDLQVFEELMKGLSKIQSNIAEKQITKHNKRENSDDSEFSTFPNMAFGRNTK